MVPSWSTTEHRVRSRPSCWQRWREQVVLQLRKKNAGKSKFSEVAHTHGVQLANQVVALMLHHAGVEALHRALERITVLIKTVVANAGKSGHHATQTRHRQAP